jgi:hypothetical protein
MHGRAQLTGVPDIGPPQPGWRYWFRYGDRLIAPFTGEIAEGPLIAAFEPPSPGIHYAPRAEDLFTHPLLRFALHPESVDVDSLTPDERGLWKLQATPFAVTFGAALGLCSVDPHPLSGGTVMRSEGYRICVVMWDSGTVDGGQVQAWTAALWARFGCQVQAGVSLRRCRHVEATLGPRLAELAAAPLPPAGKTRLMWRNGRLAEIPVRRSTIREQVEMLARVHAAVGRPRSSYSRVSFY